MRRGLSKADMNRHLLEAHQDPGEAAFLPTFYKIANETRLAGEVEVFAIERRIPGSRLCYDALLWRTLINAPATMDEATKMVELELERHGLRRASRVSVVIGPLPQIAPQKHCVPSLWQGGMRCRGRPM